MKLIELIKSAVTLKKGSFNKEIQNINNKLRNKNVVIKPDMDVSPIDMLFNNRISELEDKKNINISGEVNSVYDLPTTAKVGESYVVGTTTKDLYMCIGENEDGTPIWKSDPEIEDLTRLVEEKLEPIEEKLDTIEEGAQKNIQTDWNETDYTKEDYIKNKPFGPYYGGFESLDSDNVTPSIITIDKVINKFYPTDVKLDETTSYYENDEIYKFKYSNLKHVYGDFNLNYNHSSEVTGKGPNKISTQEFQIENTEYIINNVVIENNESDRYTVEYDFDYSNVQNLQLIIDEVNYVYYSHRKYSSYYRIVFKNSIDQLKTFYFYTSIPGNIDIAGFEDGQVVTLKCVVKQGKYIYCVVGSNNLNKGKIALVDVSTFNPLDDTGKFNIKKYIQLDETKIIYTYSIVLSEDKTTAYVCGNGNYIAIIKKANTDNYEISYKELDTTIRDYYFLDVIDENNFICSSHGMCNIYEDGVLYKFSVWKTSEVKYIDSIPFISTQATDYKFYLQKWNSETKTLNVMFNNGTGGSIHAFGKIKNNSLYYAFTYNDSKLYYSLDNGNTWNCYNKSISERINSTFDLSDILNSPCILYSSFNSSSYVGKLTLKIKDDNTIEIEKYNNYDSDYYSFIQSINKVNNEYFVSIFYNSPYGINYSYIKEFSLDYLTDNIPTGKFFIYGTGKIGSVDIRAALLETVETGKTNIYKKPKNFNSSKNQKIGCIIFDYTTKSSYILTSEDNYGKGRRGYFTKSYCFTKQNIPTLTSELTNDSNFLTPSALENVERTTSKESTIDPQTESTINYPTTKAVVSYVSKAIDESAADDITSDSEGKMAFEHTTYLFSSHNEEGVATPPNLEEGPWFKNGVQAGTNNVYVDERDYAIVLEDETRCYSYYNNYKYQRIKDGGDSLSGYVKVADSQKSWIHSQPFNLSEISNGTRPSYMFFKDNKNAEQIIFITLADRKIYIYKDVQYVEGFDNIDTKPFIDETPSIAEAFPCQIKFVDGAIQATLVTSTDQDPDLLLKYPTTKYVCTVSQTASNPVPTWQYQLTYNDVSFSQDEYVAIKSTITKTKVDSYDEHIADDEIHVTTTEKNSWNGKQNALGTSEIAAVNSGITSEKVEKLNGIEEGAQVNVQSDWNENDDTKDSYIKNRTHYLQEYKGSKQLFVIDSVQIKKNINNPISLECGFVFEEGKTYRVKIDKNSGSEITYQSDVLCETQGRVQVTDEIMLYQVGEDYQTLRYSTTNDFVEGYYYIYIEERNATLYRHVPLEDGYIPSTISRKAEVTSELNKKVDKVEGMGLSIIKESILIDGVEFQDITLKNGKYYICNDFQGFISAKWEYSSELDECSGKFNYNETSGFEITLDGVVWYGDTMIETGAYLWSIQGGIGLILKL